MCDHSNDPGGREAAMVLIDPGTPEKLGRDGIWCDPCLEPIIRALNTGGIRTVASCCGHSRAPGSIALADGRWLIISDQAPDQFPRPEEQEPRMTTTHTPIEMPILAEPACAVQDCRHEDDCPTFDAIVCLECNAAAQGSDDPTEWEGAIAKCPIFGTGVDPEQAAALKAALTNESQS